MSEKLWGELEGFLNQGRDGRWLLTDEIVGKYDCAQQHLSERPEEWTRLPDLHMWRHRDQNPWWIVHRMEDFWTDVTIFPSKINNFQFTVGNGT